MGKRVAASAFKQKKRYFGYRSFYPELATMKAFREAGVNTFTVMLSNSYNALGFPYTKYPFVWTAPDTYDFAAAEAPFEDILKEIPDARFICFVDLNTPLWWTRKLGAYGARQDSYYELGCIAASEFWRRETKNFLQALLNHLKQRFAGKIISFVFGCGGGTEWHDRCRGYESIYRFDAFKKWMAERGYPEDSVEIPSIARREKGLHEFSFTKNRDQEGYWAGYSEKEVDPLIFQDAGGLFFDPEKQKNVIDYWHFCNDLIADTVEFFLKAARECVDENVELGAVYGYVTTEGQYMLGAGGHMSYEKLLASDALDYLVAPATDRNLGGGSGSLCAVGTIHSYGKQMLNSADNCTYSSLGPDGKLVIPHWRRMHNDEEVAASLKREVAINLIDQTSVWFFDKWGGSYSSDIIRNVISQCCRIWNDAVQVPVKEAAEVLMVVDPENIYYINNMHPNSNCFQMPWKMNLNRSGAPFVIASFNDIPNLDMNHYKMVIFCHPFEFGEEKRKILDRYVCNSGRTVLWTYGPDIIRNGKWSEENVFRFCGVPFADLEIKTIDKGDWKSIYVYDPQSLAMDGLRNIFRSAGVWIYSSEPRPVYANDRFIGVHTGTAETLTVSLPKKYAKATELFSGMEFWDTACLEVTSKGPETWIFRLYEE